MKLITWQQKIYQWLHKNYWLVFLLIYAIAVRCCYPASGFFIFNFDQGKDLLNTLEMLMRGVPKLVGPWTSIPGLFFGPTWYYLLAGSIILGNFSPVAPVYMMIILGLVQVYLAYRYFGKIAGSTVAAGTLWIFVTVSAWNPFPLTLVSWILLILLQKTRQDRQLTPSRAFLFGLVASFGFHFSSAYAIFYPIIILIAWLSQKLKINWKIILMTAVGFSLPFLPQLAFEVRNNFGQTQAVIRYFQSGEEASDSLNFAKVQTIVSKSWGEIKLAFAPTVSLPDQKLADMINCGFLIMFGLMVIIWLKKIYQKQIKRPNNLLELSVFICLPIIGLIALHFNIWYLLGMMPAVVVLTSQIVATQKRGWQIIWLIGLLATGITLNLREFVWQDPSRVDVFYRQKMQIWQELKKASGGKTYQVFVYQPDIYDFAWQYIILRDSLVNKTALPVEFAYKTGETAYLPFKEKISERMTKQVGPAELTFYILETPDEDNYYFGEWRGQQEGFEEAEWTQIIGTNLQLWVKENN